MTNLSKTAAQIDAILQGNPDASTKANLLTNLGITANKTAAENASLAAFKAWAAGYDSSLDAYGLAKAGDPAPTAVLNRGYRAVEDGTIFGISNVVKGALLSCRNVSTGYKVETISDMLTKTAYRDLIENKDVISGYAHSTNTGSFYADVNYNTFAMVVKAPCTVHFSKTPTGIASYNSLVRNSSSFVSKIDVEANVNDDGFGVLKITDSTIKSIGFNFAVATDLTDFLAFSSTSPYPSNLMAGRTFFSAEQIKGTLTLKTKDEARLAIPVYNRGAGVGLVRFTANQKIVFEVYKANQSTYPTESQWLNDDNWEEIFNSVETPLDIKVNFLGDSITWYGFEETYGTGWCLQLADMLKIPRENVYAYAVGGNRLCVNQSGIESEAAGGSTPTVSGYFHATSNRAMTIRWDEMRDDADLIVVLAATNDTNVNPIGSISDTIKTTIFGAQKNLIESLATKYKGKTIIYATILQARDYNDVRTDIANAIRETCNYYGVQYIEFNLDLGVGRLNAGIQVDLSSSVSWTIDGTGMAADGTDQVADAWMGNPALSNYIPIEADMKYYLSVNQYYCFYDSSYQPLISRTAKHSLLFESLDAPSNAAYLRLMYINTSGNLPTGIVLGEMLGCALPDGIHPNQWGHDKMALLAFQKVKECLANQ